MRRIAQDRRHVGAWRRGTNRLEEIVAAAAGKQIFVGDRRIQGVCDAVAHLVLAIGLGDVRIPAREVGLPARDQVPIGHRAVEAQPGGGFRLRLKFAPLEGRTFGARICQSRALYERARTALIA